MLIVRATRQAQQTASCNHKGRSDKPLPDHASSWDRAPGRALRLEWGQFSQSPRKMQ
jgi:hypothetical protein